MIVIQSNFYKIPITIKLKHGKVFRLMVLEIIACKIRDTTSFQSSFNTLWVLGSVYTGPDPFGSGTKLVRISLLLTRDLVDPSGTDRIYCLVPNGSTYEGDPIWNRSVPVSNRSHVNRVDTYHSEFDPKRI